MPVAFVFPGQGSQAVGMGQALAQAYPEARAVLDEADAALGGGLLRLLFEGPEEELRQTANTQPAILAVSIAARRVLVKEAGGRFRLPAFYAGHSLGEYSALVAAGAMQLQDAVRALRARGTFMQEAVPAGGSGLAATPRPQPPQGGAAPQEPQAAGAGPARIVQLLLGQVTAPVRWVESVQRMALSGVDTLVELGPGKVLTGLSRRIDKKLRAFNVEDPQSLRVVLNEVFK